MITIPHATEAIRMQAFQTHTAAQPISIQPLQTQQKPHVTEARHNAEKHSLLLLNFFCVHVSSFVATDIHTTVSFVTIYGLFLLVSNVSSYWWSLLPLANLTNSESTS